MIERAGRLRAGIAGAAGEVIHSPDTGRKAEYIVRFILGGVLSAVRLFGSCAPFGSSIVAVSGHGLGGALALFGSILSYLLFGGVRWGFRYAATALLVFTANCVFKVSSISRKQWFAPLTAAFMTAITGFPYVIDARLALRPLALFIMEVVLSGGCAYFYKIALSPWTPGKSRISGAPHTISVLILAVSVTAALANIRPVGGISIGRIAACTAVMLIAYRCGATAGCAVGVAAGLVMDASSGGASALFSVAYAVSALAAALGARRGKLVFALIYISVNAAAVLWFGSTGGIPALYECFCASVIFMLIPDKSALSLTSVFLPVGSGSSGGCAAQYVRERVLRLSDAFRGLYNSVQAASSDSTDDPMSIFERVPEECCCGCALEKSCWERETEETRQNFSSAAQKMMKRGRAMVEDFPEQFRQKCLSLSNVTETVNDELRLLMYRKQYKNRVSENKSAAHRHYAEVADILGAVAEDMNIGRGGEETLEGRLLRFLRSRGIDAETEVYRDVGGRLRAEITGEDLSALTEDDEMVNTLSEVLGVRLCEKRQHGAKGKRILFMEAEPLAVSVGIAAIRKQGENVSGDRGTYFKTDEGVFYVILSDGMGSGERAAKESAGTVRVLESFLRAGLPADTALSFLNSSMQLGNEDEPLCAAVDLMGVDLFSGEMLLCKYGAAPTYIRTGDTVRRICGDSMAAGTFTGLIGSPDVARMKLEKGSTAVITSDGVSTEDSDMWLRSMLMSFSGKSEKDLAREIVQESIKRRGCEDDMTVLVVSMTDRA